MYENSIKKHLTNLKRKYLLGHLVFIIQSVKGSQEDDKLHH